MSVNFYLQTLCGDMVTPFYNVSERFFFLTQICQALNFKDNMLTGEFSSTIRTVLGNQFVRKKMSIEIFSDGGKLFLKPLLVNMMLQDCVPQR